MHQQKCVDDYTKMEGERLHFIRNNQQKLRAEEYNVYCD